MLSDTEKRAIYDSSKGLSSVGSFIKSSTITLTTDNYDVFVKGSHYIWVIQVFTHDNPACQSFSEAWDKLAKEFPYIKFGRVDFKAQHAIQPKLPFRIAEVPFFYIYQNGIEPDFVDFSIREGFERPLRKMLKKLFSNGSKFVEIEKIRKIFGKNREHPTGLYLHKDKVQYEYLFESRFQHPSEFYAAKSAASQEARKLIRETGIEISDSDKFVIKMPKGFEGDSIKLYSEFSDFIADKRFLSIYHLTPDKFERSCLPTQYDDMERYNDC